MTKIDQLTQAELARQRDTLNLIASENYPSPKVLQLLGSVWSTKYAEGYPGKRYYAGNVNADQLESFVQSKALEVFDPTHEYGVNVQVLSGSPANAMVYLAALEPGDTVLAPALASGGHLSHLHATSNWLKFFKLENYTVDSQSNSLDLELISQRLTEVKPKLLIVGFSAYPPAYKFGPICQLAHDHGALVLADVAHINGLIAAGLHDSPFKASGDGADFVSMTTHKTFRGPRGALLFAKQGWIEKINKTVFPGTSGGPHLHQMAAIGQSLLEITGEDVYPDQASFKDYARNIINTAKALESSIVAAGLEVTAPTETHLSLIKLPPELDSLEVQQRLEQAGIITNRNAIPFDSKPAWRPSGLRLGTAALASRGLTVDQARQLGGLVAGLIQSRIDVTAVQTEVTQLVQGLKWWY
jgi:glycine hydroxymethyltransferase